MAQTKDFVRDFCAHTQLDKNLVTTVVEGFEDWISNSMLNGEDVRLASIGKFKILPNTYSRSGLMKNGASLHYHKFRPSFRFRPEFRKKCDEFANTIEEGLNKREEHKKERKARLNANNNKHNLN